MAANKVTGTFTGTGAAASLAPRSYPERSSGILSLTLSAFGDATIDLERSIDGTTWTVVESYTTNTEKNIESGSSQFLYRLNCSTHVSGTIVHGLAR